MQDSPLSASEILKHFEPHCSLPLQIFIHSQLDSTNKEAERLILAQKVTFPAVLLAESQSQGKGRLGRTWESPPSKNLYLSLMIELNSQSLIAQNTLICGIALWESLSPFVKQGLELKWPNDILLNGKKIAGILSELLSPLNQKASLIIGVGININSENHDFSENLSGKASSLKIEEAKDFNRSQIAGLFISHFLNTFEEYAQTGFEPFRKKWEKYAKPRGTKVSVQEGETKYEGNYLGLSEEGYLRVQTSAGEKIVIAGDVSWDR